MAVRGHGPFWHYGEVVTNLNSCFFYYLWDPGQVTTSFCTFWAQIVWVGQGCEVES